MSVSTFVKLKLGNWLRGTHYQNYDNAPDLNLSLLQGVKSRNVAGIVTPIYGHGWEGAKLKGLTHLYAQDGIAKKERNWTILANQLSTRSGTCTQGSETKSVPTLTEAYNLGYSIAGSYDKDSIVSDEFTDSSSAICTGSYWGIMQKFYEGFCARLGNPTPENNNFMGGYMDGQNNIGRAKFNIQNGGYGSYPLHPYYVDGMKSQALARKALNLQNQTYLNDFEFFSRGMHNKINLLTGCYVGMNEPDESQFLYGQLYEAQRKYIAGIKRTVAYCSPWAQAVTLATDTQYKNPGWIIPGANGYWRVQDWHITPIWATSFLGFFFHLICEGWTMFDSLRWEQSKDPSRITISDDLNGQNRFHWESPTGAAAPSILPDTGSNRYNWRPLTNVDMSIEMTHWFARIWPIAYAAGKIKHFEHTTNGLTVPVEKGDMGDCSVITAQNLNYNQTTLLKLADARKALVVGATIGDEGFIAYYDPYRSPLAHNKAGQDIRPEVIVKCDNGRLVNMGRLTGRTMHVIYF